MSFSTLTWGVKESFRNYVEAAEGTISVSDGATRADDGAFVFAALPGGDLVVATDGTATGSMRFQGAVGFDAHGGMLKVQLRELGVEAGVDGLVLTVADSHLDDQRCAIAQLGPVTTDTAGGLSIAAEITLDGMYQIADNYPPGTALDPLRLA